MDLFRLDQIILSESSNALLKDVDDTARLINEDGPLPPAVVSSLLDLLSDRVHMSNAIEGNTLDLRETREVLRTGNLDIPKKREATEALNLGKAIEYVGENLVSPDSDLCVDELLHVHRLILKEIDDDWAGRFRDVDVTLGGAKYQPPDPLHIRGMVDSFLEQLSTCDKRVHPVLLAAWGHWAIARIHPFRNGNGRTARLWQDALLLRHRLTCAIISNNERGDYLAALESADEGQFDLLVQLVAQGVLDTFYKYRTAKDKAEGLEEWAVKLVGERDARETERRKLTYLRWSRKMEQIRFEFERGAAQITKAGSDIEIQLRKYETIDEAKWLSIRSGDPAQKTWFFTLSFRNRSSYTRYFFFFGKHYWADEMDTEEEKKEPHVTLLASEQGSSAKLARRLGEDSFETCSSFREVFVSNDRLVRKRWDAETGSDIYDRGIDALKVAQDFIQDVLLRRLS